METYLAVENDEAELEALLLNARSGIDGYMGNGKANLLDCPCPCRKIVIRSAMYVALSPSDPFP